MITISPQAISIYRLLCRKKSLSAKQIGDNLHILPNAVYRSIRVLTKFGFVKEIDEYPVRYAACSSSDALERYIQSVRNRFTILLSTERSTLPLDVSFVQNRSVLLEQTNQDLEETREQACFIVSGLEVPAETMLTYKKAIERGVTMRIIVQNLQETEKEMLVVWQKMGILVRYFPLIEARIIIFDSKIVYITSYDPNEKGSGSGVRFNNPAIATIMQDLFEQRWASSKELSTL